MVKNKQLLEASTCNQKEMQSTKINLQDNIALLNNVLGELRAEGKTPQDDTIAAHTSTIGEGQRTAVEGGAGALANSSAARRLRMARTPANSSAARRLKTAVSGASRSGAAVSGASRSGTAVSRSAAPRSAAVNGRALEEAKERARA